MLAVVRTFALLGVDAREVRAEVDVRRGLPAFSIVGLPDAAVRESRERVRAAIGNSGFEFPQKRITVSLAPANLPKAGPGFDLAIAAGVLVADEQLEERSLARVALAGELALDGAVRSIPGALPMARRARGAASLDVLGVPAANAQEAGLANLVIHNGGGPADELSVVALARLSQLRDLDALRMATAPRPSLGDPELPEGTADLAELRGQHALRRALEVAAAGGHSLMMVGPPGVGKSMAARRLPSILPPLSETEAIEALSIASACGTPTPADQARLRPFRAPHHTISTAGLVGGGSPPRPGELTRAHRGLLFLDELPEFSRDALEALRQPLEDGEVVIARAKQSLRLPCRVMLAAAANPCPCGGALRAGGCDCAPGAVRRYRMRISGPLADRVDISIEVEQPSTGELAAGPGEASAPVRRRVIAARERQHARLGEGRSNADATGAEIRRDVQLGPASAELFARKRAAEGLSGRGYDRVLRVARTIADLSGRQRVSSEDVLEAMTLRSRQSEP